MNMEHFILSKVREHFNTSQPPATAPLPQSHYQMHGVWMGTAPYTNPNIAPYITPSMANSIPTQFISNGNCYWPTPPATQYSATPPFHSHSTSTPHFNPTHQQNTQPKRIDPRLLPRPQFQQRPPPSQSTPIQSRSIAGKSRWGAPINPKLPTDKHRITLADYKRKGQSKQDDDANMDKSLVDASNSCDNTYNGSNDNVVSGMDPSNDDEPAFSPAASESNPNSPVSLTPPPNETIDDELHDRADNNHSSTVVEKPIKQENQPISCESEEPTDSEGYDSDSTVEFTLEALRKEHGLSESISNGTSADEISPSKF